MTHMSRMLFIEEHDKHKLFFEGNNGLKRGIHFESFNAKHPEDLYDKIFILKEMRTSISRLSTI